MKIVKLKADKNIRSLIKSSNLTEQELKNKLGLSEDDFSKLLEGKLIINELLALKLSYSLRTTIKYWL